LTLAYREHFTANYNGRKIGSQRQRGHYQWLRGSASPAATGFVNGTGQFSTPYRIDTRQPITKKFVTGD